MPLHYFIFTRFSILDGLTGFHSSPSGLFNTDRLDAKFNMFDKVTYPGVISQSCKSFTWYIYTSKFLPEKYKVILETYNRDNIKIVYVENFREMSQHQTDILEKSTNFATLRLDDDDGISSCFLEELNQYEDKQNSIITFSRGKKYKLVDNEIIICPIGVKWRNIALGLTAIGFNIFNAGNHGHIDKNKVFNVIENEKPDMYLLGCSEFCDGKRDFNRHIWK